MFAIPPGMTAEAAGILLLIIMPTNVAHSKRDLSQCCLFQFPAASTVFSDGWGPFLLSFLRLLSLGKKGGGGTPQSLSLKWLPKKYILKD